ncbi:hypothetical protein E4U41_005705 [Claviceps citrina]|nr:hypothetical protein E4U41_005705 [Claviceps citrina]
MAHSHYIESPEELEALLSSTNFVVVDFLADWCPSCRTIAPIYEHLASQHSRPGYMAFAEVDIDRVPSLAHTYRISAMPTFLFFKDGIQVSVNGEATIRGAEPLRLRSAVEKLSELAAKKARVDST